MKKILIILFVCIVMAGANLGLAAERGEEGSGWIHVSKQTGKDPSVHTLTEEFRNKDIQSYANYDFKVIVRSRGKISDVYYPVHISFDYDENYRSVDDMKGPKITLQLCDLDDYADSAQVHEIEIEVNNNWVYFYYTSLFPYELLAIKK